MAAARHNLTRRAVLGAAFAAPAVLAEAAPARSARERWERASAALGGAEARMRAFRNGPMAKADRAYNAIRDRWPLHHDFDADPEARTALRAAFDAYSAWEHRLNDLECAHFAAIKRLVKTPAPDLPALATKIELVVDYEVAELDGGDRCMVALKADARRLVATAEFSALSP